MTVTSIGTFSGSRFLIEDIYPSVDAGRFPIKRIVGEPVDVWTDIVRDGHDVLAADLLWRAERDSKWQRVPMRLYENDRWTASFIPPNPGRYVYAIEAWTDTFATWRRNVLVKRDAGLAVTLEAIEGGDLLCSLKPQLAADAQLVKQACEEWDRTKDLAVLLSDALAAAARNG